MLSASNVIQIGPVRGGAYVFHGVFAIYSPLLCSNVCYREVAPNVCVSMQCYHIMFVEKKSNVMFQNYCFLSEYCSWIRMVGFI